MLNGLNTLDKRRQLLQKLTASVTQALFECLMSKWLGEGCLQVSTFTQCYFCTKYAQVGTVQHPEITTLLSTIAKWVTAPWWTQQHELNPYRITVILCMLLNVLPFWTNVMPPRSEWLKWFTFTWIRSPSQGRRHILLKHQNTESCHSAETQKTTIIWTTTTVKTWNFNHLWQFEHFKYTTDITCTTSLWNTFKQKAVVQARVWLDGL
jgi:hypothetical protein